MKKILLMLCLSLISLYLCSSIEVVHAFDGDATKQYVIYTVEGDFLCERSDINIGDIYISKNFKQYEVVEINHKEFVAYAKFVKDIKRPNVTINPYPTQIGTTNKKIGLYLTHNDESYTPTDGYDSIYGKGGIHDVAKALRASLTNLGIDVTLDETLHIPHDYLAYSRSEPTAKKLLMSEPNALFDIHRDGVSRSYYVTNYNGEEKCQVRIVVGQANPYKNENLEFAIYLMSIAEEMYPWLFADIYYASGHYNQALFNKMLLFEMGTYLVEKDLVLKSVSPLANVINTALFNTTINGETGDATIGGNANSENPTLNDHLNNKGITNKNALAGSIIITCILLAIASLAIGLPIIMHNKK